MSDNPEDNGFIDAKPGVDQVDQGDPAATGDVAQPEQSAPAPPSDLEQRWAHFEALAGDVIAIAYHIGNVLPSAAPLMRLADNIKARLAQFKELIAEQQK